MSGPPVPGVIVSLSSRPVALVFEASFDELVRSASSVPS
jgi:hypothetical protein